MDEKPYRDLNTYYRNLFGGKTKTDLCVINLDLDQ